MTRTFTSFFPRLFVFILLVLTPGFFFTQITLQGEVEIHHENIEYQDYNQEIITTGDVVIFSKNIEVFDSTDVLETKKKNEIASSQEHNNNSLREREIFSSKTKKEIVAHKNKESEEIFYGNLPTQSSQDLRNYPNNIHLQAEQTFHCHYTAFLKQVLWKAISVVSAESHLTTIRSIPYKNIPKGQFSVRPPPIS